MNIFQKVMSFIFNRQYVILYTINQNNKICRAYELGGGIYANPYMPDTRTRLLPEGNTTGQSYVLRWEPITEDTVKLFNS